MKVVYQYSDDGPPIREEEVICAINTQKNGKATGPDDIHAKVLKVIAE